MSPLERQGDMVYIPIHPGEDGYLGRECPNPDCKKYFKILPSGELEGDCYCPYCGYKGDIRTFPTIDQLKYAASHVIREAADNLMKELKKLEFDSKSSGSSGFSFSMRVEPGAPYPLHVYSEKDLETHITCGNCTLKYAVYGVFAYCPDCGEPNTLQIFYENIKLIHKAIENSKSADPKLAQNMIENAFEDCVSTFDGFGRELCNIHRAKSKFPDRIHKINFQSLDSAKENFKIHFNIDLDQGIRSEEWSIANISFQKRHVLAHKLGIIDEEYIRRSGDTKAILGRKVSITSDDTLILIPIIEKLAGYMVESLSSQHDNS